MGNTISMVEISRRQLPSYERNGCEAYVIKGSLLVITFHQARIGFETLGGVAADVPHKLRAIQTGVGDTVTLGFVSRGRVHLLDILMLERRTQRGLPWSDRLEILGQFYQACKEKPGFGDKIVLAKKITRGLMKAFDNTVDTGGDGLLLKTEKKGLPVFCKKGL